MATNEKDESKKRRSDIKPEFIIHPVPQGSSKKISEAQMIQLNVIEKTNFNFFDGRKIVGLLKENHKMWRAVLMPLDLISLRDMEDGTWHADTLYIYPEDGYQFQLEELVREQFNADEVDWIGGSSAVDMLGTTEVGHISQVILSAWWD
ncbi:MAG TPA: hypothetical protein VK206_22800 [Anaerolineales bacterium]|nr:hypothetical protein [Anaerolineales bacterium]HLO31835.1 hypothetical protein [Anaerolineales bacterium]